MKVKLDLNYPGFQKEWFVLLKEDFVATKNTLKKILLMDWNQIESYIHKHSNADFSHSICPDCAKELYPDINVYDD